MKKRKSIVSKINRFLNIVLRCDEKGWPVNMEQLKNTMDTSSLLMLRKIVAFAKQLEEGSDFKNRSKLLIIDLYILSSILYYQHDTSMLSDEVYDKMCKHILKYLTVFQLTNLYDKKLIEAGALKAGSGYHMTKAPGFLGKLAEFYMETLHE